jgi:hypothetical protein
MAAALSLYFLTSCEQEMQRVTSNECGSPEEPQIVDDAGE